MTITDIIDKIVYLQSRGYSAATGLRRIAESQETTSCNDVATDFYKSGPPEIAEVAETLVEIGKIVPAHTSHWWPSSLRRLSTLDTHGYEIVDNPPRLVARHATTGTIGTASIDEPTQHAVDAAIAALVIAMRTRDHASRRRDAAQLEVDAE